MDLKYLILLFHSSPKIIYDLWLSLFPYFYLYEAIPVYNKSDISTKAKIKHLSPFLDFHKHILLQR